MLTLPAYALPDAFLGLPLYVPVPQMEAATLLVAIRRVRHRKLSGLFGWSPELRRCLHLLYPGAPALDAISLPSRRRKGTREGALRQTGSFASLIFRRRQRRLRYSRRRIAPR